MTARTPGQAPALPKVHAHPQDEAENWLAETYENADDPSVGYDRREMIDAYHSGWRRFRELVALAAQERPAPGESSPLGLKHAVTSNRLGHAVAALRELREATFEGTPEGDIVRSALANDEAIRDNVSLTREPQPAPELAAAMAESRQLLGWLDEATRAMLNLGTRPAEVNLAHRLRKQTGLAP